MSLDLTTLACIAGASIDAHDGIMIDAVAPLATANTRHISFLADARYAPQVADTAAAAVLVPEDFDGPAGQTILLRVPNVERSLVAVLQQFSPEPDVPAVGIAPTATVDPTAVIGENCRIGPSVAIGPGAVLGNGVTLSPGCVIGRDVTIGDDCVLGPNVAIYHHCRLGDRVSIFANSTIGADGFGYTMIDGALVKIPHTGIVVIGNDVEIGANACIDRAKFDQTTIGDGTKIDNLVQVAHNVQIGRQCVLASQVGLAGSCRVGDYVMFGGQVGVADHVTIGNAVQVAAQSGIHVDIADNQRVAGGPAEDIRTFFRQITFIKKLPDMAKQLKALSKKIDALCQSKRP